MTGNPRQVMWFIVLLSMSLVWGCASSTPQEPSPVATSEAAPFGLSEATAVEVCKPAGERAYLARLRCSDGSQPQFSRRGSGGSRTTPQTKAQEDEVLAQMFREGPLRPGEPDYHVVDYYEIRCGAEVTEIVMDMYHCYQTAPTQAPPNFTIVPE